LSCVIHSGIYSNRELTTKTQRRVNSEQLRAVNKAPKGQ
jgi:hypothetical protein